MQIHILLLTCLKIVLYVGILELDQINIETGVVQLYSDHIISNLHQFRLLEARQGYEIFLSFKSYISHFLLSPQTPVGRFRALRFSIPQYFIKLLLTVGPGQLDILNIVTTSLTENEKYST
ncbi:Hypothetical_protein [Hexamita inflata]|uniref:Hypothetical_protein n=1 Tax=Hexamita inflata TaxID=28002 RepID=A0AA86U7N0_9EUKA|nr:Hypothetical protein HINF_LOCUS29881 [Hexamita inflata]